MKRQELSSIDLLILSDLKEHPGSSIGQVAKRMLSHGYRSKTYIREVIDRLEAQGRIDGDRSGHAAVLTVKLS